MDNVRNASDKEQVEKAKVKSNNDRKQELDDIRTVASNASGLRFLWRYLSRCGLWKSSFSGSETTIFLEGERNIGLQLWADIHEADPVIYLKMVEQNRKDGRNG